MVPPVFSTTQVEHDCLPQLPVLDQEREGGQVHGLVPPLHRLYKSFRWHSDDDPHSQ